MPITMVALAEHILSLGALGGVGRGLYLSDVPDSARNGRFSIAQTIRHDCFSARIAKIQHGMIWHGTEIQILVPRS